MTQENDSRTILAEGSYLFSGPGFSQDNQPSLRFDDSTAFTDFHPLGSTITLTFDIATRYCTGWHDLATSEQHRCPDSATVMPPHTSCRACEQRTGFNPAFYHASTVSPQQEQRNQEPHLLYLAYFAPDVVKVRISYHKRGIRRLLEQGARAAVQLETFPSALIARQYEARIASLTGIRETVQAAYKQRLLKQPFDPAAAEAMLTATKERIEHELGVTFPEARYHNLETYYTTAPIAYADITDAPEGCISGDILAMYGPLVVFQNGDRLLVSNVKSYVGCRVERKPGAIALDTPPQQVSLF